MSESSVVSSAQQPLANDEIGAPADDATKRQAMTSKSSNDPLETAKWTRFLPEAFGIRESVRESSYRWCVREG